MAIFPIRGMGTTGIIRDRDPYDLPPNAFSSGLNVSIEDGAMVRSVGYNQLLELSDIDYGCGWFYSQDNTQIYVKSDKSIVRWNGASLSEFDSGITNNGNGYYQAAQVGNHLILNNGIDAPFAASPNATTFSPLVNWDSTWRCEVIKPYKNFMVATGIQKGVNEYPMMIKWSDVIEPNSTAANWDETDINTLAGENVLSGGDGEILDIEELGDQMMIYTPNSVWSMQFVGGQYVFNFRKVFSDTGLAAHGCVKEFNGNHICVSIDEVFIHNGTTKQSISDKRITNSLKTECSDMSVVKLHKVASKNEMWVLYKTKSSDFINKAWVWNWVDDAWTNIDIPDVKQVFNAPRLDGVVTFDDIDKAYDVSTWKYSTISPEYRDRLTMFIESTGNVDIHGTSYTFNDNQYLSYIEQGAIDLDELTGAGTADVKQLTRIYPQLSGEGSVRIRVGGANSPQGSIRWSTVVDYDVKKGHKIDVRSTYRYLAIRLEQNTPGFFKLTGWDLDINTKRYSR